MKHTPPNPRRLVPLGILASDLGLQAKALRESAERGEIPCVRVGERGLLFDRELVERVLLARAAGEPVPPTPETAPRPEGVTSDGR